MMDLGGMISGGPHGRPIIAIDIRSHKLQNTNDDGSRSRHRRTEMKNVLVYKYGKNVWGQGIRVWGYTSQKQSKCTAAVGASPPPELVNVARI